MKFVQEQRLPALVELNSFVVRYGWQLDHGFLAQSFQDGKTTFATMNRAATLGSYARCQRRGGRGLRKTRKTRKIAREFAESRQVSWIKCIYCHSCHDELLVMAICKQNQSYTVDDVSNSDGDKASDGVDYGMDEANAVSPVF